MHGSTSREATITDVSFYMNSSFGGAAVDFFYQGGIFNDLSFTTGASTTPEPSSLMLMLTGLAPALAGDAARRKTRGTAA